MRRILRKCAEFHVKKEDLKNDDLAELIGLGDLSTLADSTIIQSLLQKLVQ